MGGATIAGNPAAPKLVVFGDSVMWGQGLADENKFCNLLCFTLAAQQYPGLTVDMCAHSGAVIGKGLNPPWPSFPGEIPKGPPTILYQCDSYTGDPANTRVVLLDGGINDIDLRYLLNPTTTLASLCQKIQQYCHDDMVTLLSKVCGKFADPECRIIVCGYYPILGSDSDSNKVPELLEVRGIPHARILMHSTAMATDPRELAVKFWTESEKWLRQAVDDVIRTMGTASLSFSLPLGRKTDCFSPTPGCGGSRTTCLLRMRSWTRGLKPAFDWCRTG